jgi:putative endonuclease
MRHNVRSTSHKGREGERRAARFLQANGYRIVARNVRLPGGEIDLLCVEQSTVVFVEVKRRDAAHFGRAISGVDRRKRATLRRIAADYAQIVCPLAQIRFDIVTIDGNLLALYRNAF